MRQGAAEASEGDDVKRRIFIAAIFLLVGAVVNVAVAWGCVIWSLTPTQEDFGMDVGPWPAAVPSEWPSERSFLSTKTSLGVAELAGIGRDIELKYVQWSLRAGLPFRSLYLVRNRTEEEVTWLPADALYVFPILERPTRLQEGIQIPPSLYRRLSKTELWGRNLPTMPLWPGFAVNTIFYAVVLWLLIPGPFVLRRFVRVKRGLCPACCYPMGESAVCSECGTALPGRMAMST